MYKFSAPMAYTVEDIDRLLDINNGIEKSRITSLYACLPSNCELFTGFEQSRNFNFKHNNFEYWKKLISYSLEKGCDFIYLLNSPRPLDITNPNFTNQLERLEKLLTELKTIGVNKLRVASVQLMTYIGKHYKDFNVLASTSLEYKTIWEYQNLIHFHPEIRQIVPSHDVNKNFKMLSNLRNSYPNIEIELMVNEGCLQGCPNRTLHETIDVDVLSIINNEESLSSLYCTSICNDIMHKYPIKSLVIGNLIFPWDISEYSKIGINKFKLVGRDGYLDNFQYYIKSYKLYLKGIDNIKNMNKFLLSDIAHHLSSNNHILRYLYIKDYKKYLPDIKYFKKYGHLCASRCGVECRYCYKCAEKIQKVFEKKMRKSEEIRYVQCAKI